jgi:hypothetical protein
VPGLAQDPVAVGRLLAGMADIPAGQVEAMPRGPFDHPRPLHQLAWYKPGAISKCGLHIACDLRATWSSIVGSLK